MLTKIEITNFKSFDDTFVFDLTNTNGFTFNANAVKSGVVNTGIIYGENGVGKSNLGFAIFDIVSLLTDKNSGEDRYSHYLNAKSIETIATFKFEFKFNNGIVKYTYTKKNLETLVSEELIINNKVYASIDRIKSSEASINASGAETLKNDIGDSKISILSYISNNALLDDDINNDCFFEFFEFINKMLFFRSLEHNNYIGLEQGSNSIGRDIIDKEHIKDFEKFLNDAGIKCKLARLRTGDSYELAFKFAKKLIPFYEIASQGTKSLALFYYWYQRLELNNNVSFVFIDEFDVFYHHNLSSFIVEKLRDLDIQVILTTHNASIMSNELLRPDCYFIMDDNQIKPLTKLTDRELREGHNIEKMYRAGAFE